MTQKISEPEIGLRLEKGFNRARRNWECEHKIVIVLHHY